MFFFMWIRVSCVNTSSKVYLNIKMEIFMKIHADGFDRSLYTNENESYNIKHDL